MKRYFLLLTLAVLTACGGGAEEEVYIERPLAEIYRTAQRQLAQGKFEEAAAEFEEVERQHPHSTWAARAQLMAAYTYYIDGKYDEATLTLERFIDLNPSSEYTAYAYYLQAISYYIQITGVERDQKASYDALQSFEQVLTRYGDSIYARDAELKRDLVVDHLAGKEIEVGLYYLKQDEYAAAINRFKVVIESFDTTTHVPEALARLVEAYTSMGLLDEAIRTTAVLQYNYADNYWYEYAHKLLADVGAVPPQTDAKRDWANYDITRKQPFYSRWIEGDRSVPPPPIEATQTEATEGETAEGEAAESGEEKEEKGFSLFNWF